MQIYTNPILQTKQLASSSSTSPKMTKHEKAYEGVIIEKMRTSAHVVPRDAKDDGDESDANHDMLLVATVQVVI